MTRRNGTLIRQLFTNPCFSFVIQHEIQGSIALQLKRTRSAVASSRERIVVPRAHRAACEALRRGVVDRRVAAFERAGDREAIARAIARGPPRSIIFTQVSGR
jgi:hypothetical protein